MIWAKRRFAFADYSPYFDRLEKLLMATPTQYREFLMISTETDDPGVSDYYVGMPAEPYMAAFDGFERVQESEVPKEIDTLHIGDANEVNRRPKFRDRFRQRA